MYFKIDLEYEDILEINYVKTIYEIFNENENRLYVKSINDNRYLHFQIELL